MDANPDKPLGAVFEPAGPAGGETHRSDVEPRNVRNDMAPGRIEVGAPGPEFEARALDVSAYGQAPYRPDTAIDGWTTGPLTVRAASVRGDSHRHAGVPRQDEFALGVHGGTGTVIVAVADGVSAAPNSHFGATAACRFAIDTSLRQLDESGAVDLLEIVRGAAWALVEVARRLGYSDEVDPEVAERELATTLVAVSLRPLEEGGASVSAVSVGDSGLAVIDAGMVSRRLGGKPLGGDEITSSAVVGLPRVPHDLSVHEWRLEPEAVLLVATDGIWDPMGSGTGTLARLMAEQLGRFPPERLQFARLVDFSRETFDDDRTLVAVWAAAETSDG